MISSCSSGKKLEGNWGTVALLKDGIPVELVESNIKFTVNDKNISAKGCAGVNLFSCKIKADSKNLYASSMENTGFMGLVSEMEYEDKFFETLMNAEKYSIKNDMLFIYAPSKNMEIRLKKKCKSEIRIDDGSQNLTISTK